MNYRPWLERLEILLNRYSHLGIQADISSMNTIELWDLYVSLVQREMNERDE
jgi:hypothetical protein